MHNNGDDKDEGAAHCSSTEVRKVSFFTWQVRRVRYMDCSGSLRGGLYRRSPLRKAGNESATFSQRAINSIAASGSTDTAARHVVDRVR